MSSSENLSPRIKVESPKEKQIYTVRSTPRKLSQGDEKQSNPGADLNSQQAEVLPKHML